MKFTIHLFLTLICSHQVFAQSDIEELILELKFEEARDLANSVIANNDSNSDEYQEALYQLGVCQLNLQELDASTSTFKMGLSLEKIGNHALFWKGLALLQHEKLNYDSAIFFYDQALKITSKTEEFYIQLLIDKGDLFMAKELYKKASELFYEAKTRYDQKDIESPYLKHLVHSYIGEYYLIKNDYKKAELNLQLSLSIGKELFHPDHPMMSELHESLGLVYINLEMKDKMLFHYKRVYDINKKGKAKGSYDLIVANNIMGMSLLNARDYDEAVKYLTLAYDDMVTYFPQFYLGIHIVGMNLGITYYLLDEYGLAKKYLHECVDAGRKAYGPKAQSLGEALGYLAQTYEDDQDHETALITYNEAVNSNALLKEGELLNQFTEAVDVLTLSFALENRGLFYLKRYINEGDPTLLQLAKEDADLNLQILQKHQASLPIESRSSLSYELNYGYYLVVDVNWHLYQSNAKDIHLETVLNNIERSKSDFLRVSLALAESKSSSNIPENILVLENKLQTKKEELKARIIAGEKNGELSLPWDSLVTIQQKADSLREKMNAYIENDQSYQWKSLKNFQSQLESDRAILDFIYQEGILIQLLVTEKDAIITRDSAAFLKDHVLTFRNEIQLIADKFSTSDTLSKLLANELENLPASVRKLTIVPDGVLHYLPFDLLSFDDGYLLEKYDISYANFIEESKSNPKINDQLLSYAPNFGTDQLASLDVVRSDLAAIPGAFEEVEAINNLFSGETITSSMATETSFKRKAKNYGIIHMATHAIVDDSDPEVSRLVFNLTNDTINDGYLHAYEIYNLDLNAKLVTLSACNTGYGKIERGEGVMSLSWAFAYAGVPSTVVSLWPASDKSTPDLMKYFYQNLKEGQAKDIALNNARKQYLATAKGKARHPFYWGGFVLIGDNSPIEEPKNLLVWIFPATIILVLIGSVYRRKKSRT